MSEPRLLYLANGPERDSVARLEERFSGWGLNVDKFWAFKDEFPASLSAYDGVYLSGSPHGAYEDIGFINREHGLIQEAAEMGLPMLGICFGSQILGSALCGRDQVFRRERCEIGYNDLDIAAPAGSDLLMSGLGRNVFMFVWHNDEVRAGHPDMTVLARTKICPNHIWRFRDRPIWGIQGHAELMETEAPIWFNLNRKRMENDGADVDQLVAEVQPTPQANDLVRKFADHVRQL